MKILIVDKSAINKIFMRLLLEIMGHQVTELMTCKEANDRLSAEKFDLVITDIEPSKSGSDERNMPSGFTVVQKVRQCGGNMRVILAANSLTEEDEKYCYSYPPDAFLQRPFDQGYFRAVVGSTLVN